MSGAQACCWAIETAILLLEHKPEILRTRDWKHPKCLNVDGVNAAATDAGIGPVFEINGEYLITHHPLGESFRMSMTLMNDEAVDQILMCLHAWIEKLEIGA